MLKIPSMRIFYCSIFVCCKGQMGYLNLFRKWKFEDRSGLYFLANHCAMSLGISPSVPLPLSPYFQLSSTVVDVTRLLIAVERERERKRANNNF